MRNFILLLLFFSASQLLGQQSLLKGTVNQNVQISDGSGDTYAIYLPRNFEPERLYKGLFIFDPEGEGVQATRLFLAGMEADDFILVANTVALTDSIEANVDLGMRILDDVFKKVGIDKNQVYLAGLEEGARTASGVSVLVADIAGVLPVNDIFLNERFLRQSREEFFLGMVGNASEEYYKMKDKFYSLKSLKRDNELYEYPGESGWPSANYIGTVFNSLYQLQQDRLNLPISDSLLKTYYDSDYNTLKALVSQQNYLIAFNLVKDLKQKYRGKYDLKPLRQFQREIRRMTGYKQARRIKNRQVQEEALLLQDIAYFLEEDIALANFENLGYWDERIRAFETAAGDESRPYEQMVAKRMLGYIKNYVLEYQETLKAAGGKVIPNRIFVNVLRTILNPKDYQAYLNIIRLSALDRDENTAYFYLEELLKNGFDDYEALYSIPDTELLRIKPTYNEIIKNYLDRSRF